MSFGDIERLNRSLAEAAEQMKGPGLRMEEAVRAAQVVTWPRMTAMKTISDIMKQSQASHSSIMQSIFKQMNVRTNVAGQIAKLLNVQKQIADVMKPVRQALSCRQDMISAVMKPLQEAMVFRQNIIAEAIRPLQDQLASLAESLRECKLDININDGTLTIDGETYGVNEIEQIEIEYLYGETGILAKPNTQVAWEAVPPAIRFVIKAILAALIGMVLQWCIWGSPKEYRQMRHERKVEVQLIKREMAAQQQYAIVPPFVNAEWLDVHEAPKKKTTVVATLSYPQEVTILRVKKKKRWVLIEWRDKSGTVRQGWTLGRYIFRQPGTREKSNE